MSLPITQMTQTARQPETKVPSSKALVLFTADGTPVDLAEIAQRISDLEGFDGSMNVVNITDNGDGTWTASDTIDE